MPAVLKSSWGLFVLITFLTGPITLIIDSNFARQELKALQVFVTQTESGIDQTSQAEAQLSPSIQLLLYGDPSQLQNQARWRPLHETHPESPLFYARYLQKIKSLPPEFHETINQIAPQNGWFDLWEIIQTTSATFREIKNEEEDEWTDPILHYEILNEKALIRAIELLHIAANKEPFTDYYLESQNLLLAELPKPKIWLDQINHISQILRLSPPITGMMRLHQFIGAACQFTITRNDKDAFLQLEDSLQKLSHKISHNSHDLIGGVIFEALLTRISQQLVFGARHFKLPTLEEKYCSLRNTLDQHKIQSSSQRNGKIAENNQLLLEAHGSILARLATPINPTTKAIELTKEDLLPSCRAENAVFSRLFTSALFILFTALGLDAWIKNFRLSKNLAAAAPSSPSPSPTRWNHLVFSVLLPFSFLLSLHYLTSAGGIDRAFSSSQFLHRTLAFWAIALFLLTTIHLTARHFTRPPETRFRSDIVLLALPLFVLLLGAISYHFNQKNFILILAVIVALTSTSRLGFLVFRSRRQNATSTDPKTTLATPAFFLIAGLFGIWTLVLIAEEKFWIDQDHFARPTRHFANQYEAKIFSRYHEEIKTLLP